MEEEILTQISKEKFRRKLLICSRILAFFLIFCLLFVGYNTYQAQKEYGELIKSATNAPCFACGYNYGMRCEYVYVNTQFNTSEKEEFLLDLGFYNTNQSRTKITGGLPHYDFANFTNITVVNNS